VVFDRSSSIILEQRMPTQQQLFAAIGAGQTDTLLGLLSADPSLVDARNKSGLSAVLYATYIGMNEIAKTLIDRGARLDIFEAAATGTQERLEQLLLNDPAKLNSFSPDGWTPLHLAVFFGRVNITHVLLSEGADLNAVSRTQERVTPLHSALANPHNTALAQVLIDAGADINTAQLQGYTPLHYAAANGLETIARRLLERGADRSVRDKTGKTASDLAREKGHLALADLL
jgi:ankyrin repeat protein